MFNFLADVGNYEDRCVARYDTEELFVSTARVSDGRQPYETAVAHKDYNDNKLVVVQSYDTKKEAEEGHNNWLKLMQTNLPDYLRDCGNSFISYAMEADDESNMIFPRNV